MNKTVGIVGVGKMGVPIAANLIERGWSVLGYRRSSMETFVAVGGVPAESPAAIAETCAVVITILPDRPALDDVVFGEKGLLAGDNPGLVVIEMSTLLEADKRPALAAIQAAGSDLLDCPISGIPVMIAPRLATVFASGTAESVGRVGAVLDDIGPWRNVGEFGAGAKMKYVANLLVSVHAAVAAEAIVFAERVGLDPAMVLEAVTGTIASSATFERRVPMMLAGNWDQRPGPIQTMHDILEQIETTGVAAGSPLPVFSAAKRIYDDAMDDGWGALDISALFLRLRGDDLPAAHSATRPTGGTGQ